MESTNHAKQINRPHLFLLSLRSRSNSAKDVQYNSPRVEAYEEEDAETSRQLSVDLLEEE
jgi:hypothetical protein